MADNPWHLEALGLPAHADIVAVRRAYAARLRLIDPAADPAAFAQLRAAFESARAWCDEYHSADMGAVHTGPHATSATESVSIVPPGPQDDAPALAALGRLASGAAEGNAANVDDLLDGALASLRHGYIDAPGQFEDLLIDALRKCSVEQRARLFDAASRAFHWYEVGRLRAHDARAEWVARVLAQRETWLTLDTRWRDTWLALIVRAGGGINGNVARRWPDIGRLRTLFPEWLTLHIAPAQLSAWESAFNALPAVTRDEFIQRAAPASAILPYGGRGEPGRRRRRIPPRTWAIIWFVLMLCYLVANGIWTADNHGKTEPLPDFGARPLSPRECEALYVRFDSPAAFTGMPANDVVQAKRRAQRCALDGHWHSPSGNVSVPEH